MIDGGGGQFSLVIAARSGSWIPPDQARARLVGALDDKAGREGQYDYWSVIATLSRNPWWCTRGSGSGVMDPGSRPG